MAARGGGGRSRWWSSDGGSSYGSGDGRGGGGYDSGYAGRGNSFGGRDSDRDEGGGGYQAKSFHDSMGNAGEKHDMSRIEVHPIIVWDCVARPDPEFVVMLTSGLTASIALEKVLSTNGAQLESGKTVLVMAAAGGTGQIAVQVLKKGFPKGVDIVYESVGGDMFGMCFISLADYG
ncbi:probable quinone oxidoreductase [Tanacetum coccineum]